jgi:single-strand DNA-binding protein
MNQVFLMGNLTRDPSMRATPGGMTVGELGLAVSDSYKDKEGGTVDRTCFVDVVVWGRQAETCVEFLKKGAKVLVEGRLQLDQWQTEQGEKRQRLRVRAQRVHFVSRPGGGGSAAEGARSASAPVEEILPVPF